MSPSNALVVLIHLTSSIAKAVFVISCRRQVPLIAIPLENILPSVSTTAFWSQTFTMEHVEDLQLKAAHETLFNAGLKTRYEVAGKEYVDKSLLNGSSEFARPMQELVTEACWGSVWQRTGIERKTRSLLNIAMLCALNRGPELAVHVRGALRNGASEVEIREVLLQVAIYCGMPAGLEGFKIAERVILEVKGEQGSG